MSFRAQNLARFTDATINATEQIEMEKALIWGSAGALYYIYCRSERVVHTSLEGVNFPGGYESNPEGGARGPRPHWRNSPGR